MRDEFIPVSEVAGILGVEPRTMARWRLHENREKPWFLPAYPSPNDKRKLLYKWEDLRDFANRNPRYQDRIISWYARDISQSGGFRHRPITPAISLALSSLRA